MKEINKTHTHRHTYIVVTLTYEAFVVVDISYYYLFFFFCNFKISSPYVLLKYLHLLTILKITKSASGTKYIYLLQVLYTSMRLILDRNQKKSIGNH